ncbi:hypothetical protein BJV74DRAFT_987332 [Russula compacta]|nr:hypothetical protein BJV74DRAFT_987332 [Russula compacta]
MGSPSQASKIFCLRFRVRPSKPPSLYPSQLQTELALATSDENVQLTQKVRELEVEVTVWKQALSNTTRGGLDRENKMVTFSDPQKNVALCVIDGTRSVFSAEYITQGEEGGRKAGQEIIRGITGYFANDLQDLNPKLAITIYIWKARLRNDLVAINLCTLEEFDQFFFGLNETPCINIVEVSSKRSAEKKIVEYLQLFSGLSQTVRVFYSGGNGPEYMTIKPTLEACGASSKLVILRSHSILSNGSFPRVTSHALEGLFMKNPPTGQYNPPTPKATVSPSPFPVAEADEPNGRTPSPKPYHFQRRQSFIDPDLPLYKQNPPPCNEHYLMDHCSKEGRCKYSHEYDLTDEQLETLARSAKQSPCWFLNTDRECPHGVLCCWGHVCPFGMTCQYFHRKSCRFKGSGMHRPMGDPNSI